MVSLGDRFHPPLGDRASREDVFGQWPAVVVQQLGRVLPDRYVAAPRVHLGSQVEIAVATLGTEPARQPLVAQRASLLRQGVAATSVDTVAIG